MRIVVDKSAGAFYIYLNSESMGKHGVVKKTITADENINIDYDKDGKLIGIEVLALSLVDLEELKKLEYLE